jgi:hypothetical protein
VLFVSACLRGGELGGGGCTDACALILRIIDLLSNLCKVEPAAGAERIGRRRVGEAAGAHVLLPVTDRLRLGSVVLRGGTLIGRLVRVADLTGGQTHEALWDQRLEELRLVATANGGVAHVPRRDPEQPELGVWCNTQACQSSPARALVLCIKPTSWLLVLKIPTLHYEISYG